jgi:D-arabinose 1-dehydrogenase-like Zn-dependent alcohol dehydrogenase
LRVTAAGSYAEFTEVRAKTPQSSPETLVIHASECPLDEANAVLDGLKDGTISGKVVLRP